MRAEQSWYTAQQQHFFFDAVSIHSYQTLDSFSLSLHARPAAPYITPQVLGHQPAALPRHRHLHRFRPAAAAPPAHHDSGGRPAASDTRRPAGGGAGGVQCGCGRAARAVLRSAAGAV